jgi:hypothetical protein
MTFEEAKKALALGYKIRRKAWKKHWWCVAMFAKSDPDKPTVWFMVMPMNGKKAYQRVTRLEETAIDWEKVA